MATNVVALTQTEIAELRAHLGAITRLLGEAEVPAAAIRVKRKYTKRAKPETKQAAVKANRGWPKGKPRGPRKAKTVDVTEVSNGFAPTEFAQ